MILSAVVAMASNRVIGIDNALPWHIPEDLKFFRDTTKGKIMIMGRKTFESLPKPLPGRFHLVITRNLHYKTEPHSMVQIVSSLESALQIAQSMIPAWPEEVCLIGGGEIFKEGLSRLDRLYLTLIEKDYEGDAFFPEFDLNDFVLAKNERREGNPPFSFQLYERKSAKV